MPWHDPTLIKQMCYLLLEDSFFSDFFVALLSFFTVADLLFLTSLRPDELTPVDLDCVAARFDLAFCPDEGFDTDLLVTVVDDFRVVTALLSVRGLLTDLFVTEVFDLLVVLRLVVEDGFVTDLLFTDLDDLLVVVPIFLSFDRFVLVLFTAGVDLRVVVE